MNIDHSFTSKVKHRACSNGIAHHELFHNFGSMYKVCRYYDEGSPEVSAGPPEVPGPPDVSGPPVVSEFSPEVSGGSNVTSEGPPEVSYNFDV